MKTPRRTFLQAGTVGAAAAIGASLARASSGSELDPTVSRRPGPHGEGLPITMAGHLYERVRPLAEGAVTVEGCATRFEVTSIGPLNTHVFSGPQTGSATALGLADTESPRHQNPTSCRA